MKNNNSRLWYTEAGNGDWNRALPIGNGKLGAMIYGEKNSEHFQLNEDSVWFGNKRNRNNPDALQNLGTIRDLILNGKISEAEELAKYALTGTPQSQHSYQTLGDVYFDYCGKIKNPIKFERSLPLDEAIYQATVTESTTEVTYTREAFVSFDFNCIVVKFLADKEGELDLALSLQRHSFYETTEHTKDSLYIGGNPGGRGMDFCCGMKVVSDGESLQGIGEHIVTKKATQVLVFITATTEFRSENPRKTVEDLLETVSKENYGRVKEQHIREYQTYFNTMRLSLDYDHNLDKLTTEQRLSRISEEVSDHGLLNTYLDYGRYLLISSSRGNSLPANLQGLWNKDLDAPWGSKYTININTEMNYWPSGPCHLSLCQEPLFALVEKIKENGQETAKEMYGCRGFVAHHNTDLWGDTAPQDIYVPATFWPMGGAWLCTHIWNHYLYTCDKDFLARMYPVLKESVLFFCDFLIEVGGYYVTCPSESPENIYVMKDGTKGCLTYGCTMDNEILRELFTHFLKVSKELRQEFLVEKVKEMLEKIPDIKIGKHGQIMEWMEDYDEWEPGHRHISHLWALHPAQQITPDGTPQLCEGAKVTLERRLKNGGGHTGWSRAWIINMYARLWEGDLAYKHIIALLKKSTLTNLLDNHPPFQIDGNFGAIAGMVELLLQSSEERTILLPALPEAWRKGLVTGVVGVGGLVYDISWEESRLYMVTIYAKKSQEVKLVYKREERIVCVGDEETVSIIWASENK